MKVLCALGVRHAWDLVDHVLGLCSTDNLTLLLVYVINEEHHEDVWHLPGGFGRHALREERNQSMREAEQDAATTTLARAATAAMQHGLLERSIEQRMLRGHPERVIVALAETEQCDVIVLRASDDVQVRVPRGPHSVGHTARYILDHAPCAVLLIRT